MEHKSFFSGDRFILLTALAALISGAIGWFYFPLIFRIADIVAEIFMNLLKLISLPIIFLSIVSTISNMKSFEEMRILGKKVLKYTISTTLIAAGIGLALFKLINPVTLASGLTRGLVAPSHTQSYMAFLLKIIPSNLIEAFGDNANVMSIVFIAFLLSYAVLSLAPEEKGVLQKLFSSLFGAVLKITNLIIYVMPIGVWAFITLFMREMLGNYYTGQNGVVGLQSIALYTATIILANIVQGTVVLPALLRLKGIKPMVALRAMYKALVVAFFSKSSNATLPLTIKCAEQNAGVSKRVARFTLPMCAVINMNGCAAFILITVLYVSMSHGVTFSYLDMIAWIFIATLAAVGNAGVPMGCYFLTSAFLVGMNVPLHLMGVILPIYTIIDMIETALNVWSDSVIAIVVDKELKE